MSVPRLGIIAGRGALPGLLIEAAERQGREVIIAEMDGFESDVSTQHPKLHFRVERLSTLFEDLKAQKVSEVVLAGAVRRPSLAPRHFNLRTLLIALKFVPAFRRGDDALLRVVVGLFEAAGFKVRGAQELVPDLVATPGLLTTVEPSTDDRKDAESGMALLRVMGAADLGQSAVVAAGRVLGVEAAPGTDVMLGQIAALPLELRPDGAKGVFVKAPKPAQDRRVDLPTIGPETIRGVVSAGLSGIVIEAGGVILLERDRVIADCEAAGLFLWAREADP